MMTTEERVRFIASITSPDFSHVTTRSWCGQMIVYVYHSNPTSPSGVLLADGASEIDADPILREHGLRAHHGPTRGDMAGHV